LPASRKSSSPSRWQFWRRAQRIQRFDELVPGRIELDGTVEALATLAHPVTGEPCVALEYHASPPSLLSVNGVPYSSRAFTVSAVQAVDFVLTDGARRVLVRVGDEQDDVARMHAHLLDQHGLRLRVEVGAVRAGARVCVLGRVQGLEAGTAYRSLDYVAAIEAERFWEVV
jgi:hypothetical protein